MSFCGMNAGAGVSFSLEIGASTIANYAMDGLIYSHFMIAIA